MKRFLSLILLFTSVNLFAVDAINVEKARIRLTPPNSPVTAMFFNVTNHSNKVIKLISVNSDFAEKFELHTMELSGGTMAMRQVNSIEVKKNETVKLKTGGFHVMVFNIKKPLKEGESHKVNLVFEDKTILQIEAKVEKI